MAQQLHQDFLTGTLRHRFRHEIAHGSGEEAVAPEDLDVGGLMQEVRLLRDDDAHEPGAVLEGDERAGAGHVAAPGGQAVEKGRVVQRDGEGEPGGLVGARKEGRRLAERGAMVGRFG